jgi:hypothetical protein
MPEDYVNYRDSYPNLQEALKNGAKLHAFLSGGSLRVVRIEKMNKETGKNELLSYGEHPYFSGALAHADEDFGLSYDQQYTAKGAKHLHYLTGAYSLPYDVLDAHIKDGRSIDVIYCKRWGQYICTTPVPFNLRRNNEILWGSSDNILGAFLACLLSFQFEDKEEFEKRI